MSNNMSYLRGVERGRERGREERGGGEREREKEEGERDRGGEAVAEETVLILLYSF